MDVVAWSGEKVMEAGRTGPMYCCCLMLSLSIQKINLSIQEEQHNAMIFMVCKGFMWVKVDGFLLIEW